MTAFDRPGWSAAIDRVTQNTPAVPPRTAGATGEAGSTPVPGLPTSPKWPVRVNEAWDGGCVEVQPTDSTGVQQRVVVEVVQRGSSVAAVDLTVPEVDDLIAALQAARAEIAPPERDPLLPPRSLADDQGHAALSVLLPVVGLGGGMLLLAAATGKLAHLITHLPATDRPNSFALLLVAALLGICWHLIRADLKAGPAVYELADWDDDDRDDEADEALAVMLEQEFGYARGDDPYYSTDADHDPTGWRP